MRVCVRACEGCVCDVCVVLALSIEEEKNNLIFSFEIWHS